jgi:hypothetical protein
MKNYNEKVEFYSKIIAMLAVGLMVATLITSLIFLL